MWNDGESIPPPDQPDECDLSIQGDMVYNFCPEGLNPKTECLEAEVATNKAMKWMDDTEGPETGFFPNTLS
jgi:hypothetical protein